VKQGVKQGVKRREKQRMRQCGGESPRRGVGRALKPPSGGFAFVKRQRHSLRMIRMMLKAAAARAHAAFHHDAAHGIRALATAGGDAEFELEFVERIDAFRDRGTDLSVRNRLADTDNHGRAS